jgi:anti-sigma B factor antagonist
MGLMTAFAATPTIYRDYARLAVAGELDLATTHLLAEHGINLLLEPALATLVLDLEQVCFIDASGIGALVRIRNAACHVSKQLLLIRVPPCLQRLLNLTGLDVHFEQTLGADDRIELLLTQRQQDGLAAPPSICDHKAAVRRPTQS